MVCFAWLVYHQRKLRLRAHLMQAAIRNHDFTFRLPPVPFDGQWQIRLGFAAEPTRGVAQIYYDDKPQGIPLDMTKNLSDASILGSNWKADYNSMTSLELSTAQKELKNMSQVQQDLNAAREAVEAAENKVETTTEKVENL